MFGTPICEGQRRLAIVVAAETMPFVISGSFCAPDVCWECEEIQSDMFSFEVLERDA